MSAIKICGLTIVEDAVAAAEAGATHLGIVFHKQSSRYVSLRRARTLIREVRCRGHACDWIGVFVDQPAGRILRIADQLGLNGVQLHGSEPTAAAESLLQHGLFVVRAFRVSQTSERKAPIAQPASAYLLDSYDPDRFGGTGRSFDWSMVPELQLDRPILLAGGLAPENVAAAIRIVRPWGVDVSSGVEIAPGKKSADKMCRFVAAARAALQREERHDASPL